MDSGTHTASPVLPIAIDEAFANLMAEPNSKPIVHLWIYERALFLGRRDAKLPRLEKALQQTARQGYGALLRSSGGACVPLDQGVLNMAILLPDRNISIDDFFQLATSMLQEGLSSYGEIEIGEVLGSYCVGDYDFAMNGKKIGGMAQRRTRFGSILQLCINVEGSGLERGRLMERFYQEAGLQEMESHKPIPSIEAETIGSVSDQMKKEITVAEVKSALWDAFSKCHSAKQVPFRIDLESVENARTHLQDKLGLFAFTARELQEDSWRLP
ncbi:lipoate--protein ligase family protein [Brevibacillus ginsengisoli]|uniref:lipoate--protein ligase family protein n=1 Tax=Brevibacillus ginsengisoli TaxID=363854 RepID=UPI003CED4D67